MVCEGEDTDDLHKAVTDNVDSYLKSWAEAAKNHLLHLAHAGANGHEKAFVRTADSDVVILTIHFFSRLGLTELWIGFAGGKNYRDIPVHDISRNLGPQKSLALPLFHAFTGCDTTSAFLGHGKKSAWAAWEATPDLTESLVTLTLDPEQINNDAHLQRLERMVIIMYSKTCGSSRVDEARQHLFSNGTKSLENLPPTQAALMQHTRRALLQASFYWSQAVVVQQDIPEFSSWGWYRDSTSKTWEPYWTTLADASKACTILLHCGCKKSCTGRCKCFKAGVHCTSICACEGACTNNDGER